MAPLAHIPQPGDVLRPARRELVSVLLLFCGVCVGGLVFGCGVGEGGGWGVGWFLGVVFVGGFYWCVGVCVYIHTDTQSTHSTFTVS